MELISSAFLGFIQGLTEFLPISSSGHLELISNIFDFSKPDITFDVFVHFPMESSMKDNLTWSKTQCF